MNPEKFLITFLSPTLRYGDVEIAGAEGHGIPPGVTAVLGPNGAGKTTLGTILERGRYAFGNRLSFVREGMKVRMLRFTDIHSFTGVDVLRYDQRLESSENEFVPTVREVMAPVIGTPRWEHLCDGLRLHGVEEKKINFLSSGELRKLLIINTLLAEPDILVLDNPYIGLDAPSRGELDTALRTLAGEGASIVMLVCDPAEIPAYCGAVMSLEGCRILSLTEGYDAPPAHAAADPGPMEELPEASGELPQFATAFAIRGGTLRYGAKTVISGLDWEVRRGERWMLTGPNGSGKSLLLSIVCGDNPQAYSNDVTIFDRPRGSGESIWDIKDRIGYVCPEMQLYFRSPLTVEGIVVEGMRPWLRRFGAAAPAELATARRWLSLLGISDTAGRRFDSLSSAQQRMVLLARAFVRQPALLILDEPFQGLDAAHKERVRRVIDRLCASRGTTLIFVTHYPSELPSSVDRHKDLGEA